MTDQGIPDVVGAHEVHEILGVELERVTLWRKRGRLPPPYAHPICSPVWVRADIERFRDAGMQIDGYTTPPRESPLLGTAEVSDVLRVDKSQIARWRRKPPQKPPRLPEPRCEIKAGPLWDRRDIARFARAREAVRARG